jgi:hypothetical protein
MPEICPFLALGLYFLAFRGLASGEKGLLFQGKDQYQRASTGLQRKAVELKDMLECFGIKPQDIGTHSSRKGSTTYMASGSTAGPGMAAICIRAGWTVGAIQDRYIQFDLAGDQHAGRTVCGLPASSHQFSVLPPHFKKTDGSGNAIPG